MQGHSAKPKSNVTLELLAADILRGLGLINGPGLMPHARYGVTLLSMLSNIMDMIGVSAFTQILVTNVVIIPVVIVPFVLQ